MLERRGEERRGEERRGEERRKLSQDEWRQEKEGTEDTSPDVEPPPDSHWPTERAPDDGGSSPRPHAEPAALQAAGLSEGEEAGADERGRDGESRNYSEQADS